jgi:hypothetical protein
MSYLVIKTKANNGCARYIGTVLAGVLSLLGFLSPVAMVVLPKLGIGNWDTEPCAVECEGLLISFAFKLLILCIATVALFFRQPKATMPRVFLFQNPGCSTLNTQRTNVITFPFTIRGTKNFNNKHKQQDGEMQVITTDFMMS